MNRDDISSAEERIATLAGRQHGVVARFQLLEAGLTSGMVKRRVRAGRLQPIHRGVYLRGSLVGPLEPPRARAMAAVLACGTGAVVSHESAARLWDLLRPGRARTPIHVTVPGADRGRRPGIRPHRVAALPDIDLTVVEGIPVTAPARTLVDLAASVRPRTLEQVMARAERKQLVRVQDLEAVLARRRGRRGTRLLLELLESRDSPALTRSAAEERFLALVRKGALPEPETNLTLDRFEIDFLWRSERVVVEVDGFAHHGSRRMFENDRRRDARLASLGFRVVRVTWRQLAGESHAVLVRLARLLALAGVDS